MGRVPKELIEEHHNKKYGKARPSWIYYIIKYEKLYDNKENIKYYRFRERLVWLELALKNPWKMFKAYVLKKKRTYYIITLLIFLWLLIEFNNRFFLVFEFWSR